ncbi:hypothetical protein DACRYDRAFT_115737 [Dacryopinax primogenitus]|uniref:TPR-like protein n=1 Tax=Dacryopinax primogenitus (strain DJM 731) TaxID=1858805 RepID=M5G226_DACPD|nr:uncharacterized protein DACRYDRAFT_115737 [Dacryopinax primogenitus]EJU02744.1 hypothetical protein DACRYDRAFT_115737 [Dacryopinax primogenitus]
MALSSSDYPAGLRTSLDQWTAQIQAGTVLEPVKRALVEGTTRLLGLYDVVREQQDDSRELAAKASLVDQLVLRRISANADLGPTEVSLIQELTDAIGQVDVFIRKSQKSLGHVRRLAFPDELAKLRKKLDGICSTYMLVYVSDIDDRVRVLERGAAGSLSQIPAHLPLADLPPLPSNFHGRGALLSLLLTLLQSKAHIPLLGPGGIGKTSLASALLNDPSIRARFGENRFFISCEGLVTAEGVLNALAAAVGLRPQADPRRALFAALETTSCALLVLDNLETAWEAERVQVEALLGKLAQHPKVSLVITMRGALRPGGVSWAEGCEPLAPVSLAAAREIWIGIAGPDGDPKARDDLLLRLDGLPLAITLLAHQGQLLSPSELLDAYESEKTALVETGRERLTSLEVSIRLSLSTPSVAQNPEARKLLSLLALLPDGAPVAALRLMVPSMLNSRKNALVLLAVALLIRNNDRIRCLTPIRDFMLDHYPPDPSSFQELRTYFTNMTASVHQINDNPKETIGRLSPDFGNINSVLMYSWTLAADKPIMTILLTSTLQLAQFSYLATFGDCTSLLTGARSALQSIHSDLGIALCTQRRGKILTVRSRWLDGMTNFEEARKLFELVGDRMRTAECMQSIGGALYMLSRYDEGIDILNKAKAEFEALGVRYGAAQCMHTLGDTFHMLDRYDDALSTLRAAKAEFEAIGERRFAAYCARSIAEVLVITSDNKEAISMLEEAQTQFKALGDRSGAAHCLVSLGNVQSIENKTDDALKNLEMARNQFTAIGDEFGKAQCALNIGNVLLDSDRYEDALSNLYEAKAEFERLGGRTGMAQCTQCIGKALTSVAKYDDAVSALEDARAQFKAMGQLFGEVACVTLLATVHVQAKRPEDAKRNYEEAREMFGRLGLTDLVTQCDEEIAGLGTQN